MTRFIMGFQIFLLLVFVTGRNVEANPSDRCLEMVKLEDEFDSLIKLEGPERLNHFCISMRSFLRCMNEVMMDQMRLTMKEFARLLNGTEVGNLMAVLVNIEDFVEEICTEGTELHEEYLMGGQCVRSNGERDLVELCRSQAAQAYEVFQELQTQRKIGQQNDKCVLTAYLTGCVAASLRDECGDRAFDRFKIFIKKTGIFRSGICSADLMQTLKTTFIEKLNLSESQKSVYRMIFDLKKRRK